MLCYGEVSNAKSSREHYEACWCETNDKEKTKSIADAENHISDLTSKIEESTCNRLCEALTPWCNHDHLLIGAIGQQGAGHWNKYENRVNPGSGLVSDVTVFLFVNSVGLSLPCVFVCESEGIVCVSRCPLLNIQEASSDQESPCDSMHQFIETSFSRKKS